MRTLLLVLLMASVLCLFPFIAQSQSTMEFQSGTTIEVTAGADICADNITINGTYSGSGTQCGGPLPVELVTFTASLVKDIVTLNWKTATEVKNYGFEIERTTKLLDASTAQWLKVGFVRGSGTSNAPHEYTFTDAKLPVGRYEYRLKQVDNDGSCEYSQAEEVVIEPPISFALEQNFPNPFNPSTIIQYQLPSPQFVTVKIFDMLGREVVTLVSEQKEAGIYSATWNATDQPSGMYFCRIKAAGFVATKKLLLVR